MNPAGFLFDLNFMDVIEEAIGRRENRLEYRRLRDVSNPFTVPEFLFKKMYRLSKILVQQVLSPEIEPHLTEGIRNTYIPVHIRILATLHFLAQGSYQSGVGKDLNLAVSQPMVSRIINQVTEVITNHLFPRYVTFPVTEHDVQIVKQGFADKFNFPNVLGAIDCTHIAIISPPVNDPIQPAIAYLNRKGYFSLNVQGICDSNLKLLAVNARYPGSTHDAAIWTMSTIQRHLKRKFEERFDLTWLIGDSGYPLQPWLMTPIPDAPEDTLEGRYTHRHCSARNVIERCFGVLKQRFRCLLKHRDLHYSHGVAGRIVYACATLHNLCISHNIDYNDVCGGDVFNNDIDIPGKNL